VEGRCDRVREPAADREARPHRTFLDHDLAPSRRITAAEAAKFENPDAIMQRFKKEFAGLFEDHL